MKKFLFTVLLSCLMVSCFDTPKKQATVTSETTIEVATPTTWLAAYMALKDALVQTNSAQAKKVAVQFKNILTSISTDALSEEAKKSFDDLLPGIRYDLNQIENLDIKEQRIVFKALSQKAIALTQVLELNVTVYQQYCPMYASGSSWLSLSEEIRNPYFGDKMLKCGVIEATFAP